MGTVSGRKTDAIRLQRLLTGDSCGVDVGCHIGSFLSLIIKYAPQGKHIAIEASEVKSRWLKNRFTTVESFPMPSVMSLVREF